MPSETQTHLSLDIGCLSDLVFYPLTPELQVFHNLSAGQRHHTVLEENLYLSTRRKTRRQNIFMALVS